MLPFSEDTNKKLNAIHKYCKDNEIFYLKLDICLPDGILAEAKYLYDNHYFVPYPTHHHDHAGWKACSLHGIEWNEVSNIHDKQSGHKWTSIVQYAPIMTRWLKESFPNDGNYKRCRFVLFEKGGYIGPHTDTAKPWKRGDPIKYNIFEAVNISINQPDGFYLRRVKDQLEVPFEPGCVFLFDNNIIHEAANFSDEPRFHFIIHGGDQCEERANLYIRSFEKEHPNAKLWRERT